MVRVFLLRHEVDSGDCEMDDGLDVTPLAAGSKRRRDDSVENEDSSKSQRTDAVDFTPQHSPSKAQTSSVPAPTGATEPIIPKESPPYETPLDLRYPLHWNPHTLDGRATFNETIRACACQFGRSAMYAGTQSSLCSCSQASKALRNAQEALWNDDVRLSIGIARMSHCPGYSPPFFQIEMEAQTKWKWSSIHGTIVKLISKNFGSIEECRKMIPSWKELNSTLTPLTFETLRNLYTSAQPSQANKHIDNDIMADHKQDDGSGTPLPTAGSQRQRDITQATSSAPVGTTRIEALIPTGPDDPPYEKPLDLRYPLHWDNSGRQAFHDTINPWYPCPCGDCDAEPPLRNPDGSPEQALRAVLDEIRHDHHWRGLCVWLGVIVHHGRTSPEYFQVSLIESENVSWKDVHETVVAFIAKSFGHLEIYVNSPIRYVMDEYDEVMSYAMYD